MVQPLLRLMAAAGLVATAASAQAPGDTLLADPCVAVVDLATLHYADAAYADVERLAAPCAARPEVPTSVRVRAYRLLALSYIRQDLFHEAQVAIVQLHATDPAYAPDPVQDPPVFVALVTSIQNQLRVVQAASAESSAPAPASGTVVHLNTASEAELDALPGIGPVIASRIVAYRTQHGPFQRVEDLRQVSGIGARTFERLAPYLTVAPSAAPSRLMASAAGGVASVLPDSAAPATPAPLRSDLQQRININTATAEELDTLPGIGPALAARILAYRAQHGPFRRVEDLESVSGIGPRSIERLESLVTTGDD